MRGPDQRHEDVLERALLRLQVAELEAAAGDLAQQARDACLLAVGLEAEDQRHAVVGQRQLNRRPAAGGTASRLSVQVQAQFLAAQLAHQRAPCPPPGSARPC